MNLALVEYKLGRSFRAERNLDLIICVFLLFAGLLLLYKGIAGNQANAHIQFTTGVTMLIAGGFGYKGFKDKYVIRTFHTGLSKAEHMALARKISDHFCDEPTSIQDDHLRFHINGGMWKLGFLVDMYWDEGNIAYNLRISRGILDVFGAGRKRVREIEEMIAAYK